MEFNNTVINLTILIVILFHSGVKFGKSRTLVLLQILLTPYLYLIAKKRWFTIFLIHSQAVHLRVTI